MSLKEFHYHKNGWLLGAQSRVQIVTDDLPYDLISYAIKKNIVAKNIPASAINID